MISIKFQFEIVKQEIQTQIKLMNKHHNCCQKSMHEKIQFNFARNIKICFVIFAVFCLDKICLQKIVAIVDFSTFFHNDNLCFILVFKAKKKQQTRLEIERKS